MCRNQTVSEVSDQLEECFLGEVNQNCRPNRPWTAKVQVAYEGVSEHITVFKLDTGADVTVCGSNNFKGSLAKLSESNKKLKGPSNTLLPVKGMINAELRVGNKVISEQIYVVDNQISNLLSKRACVALSLIKCNDECVVNVSVSNNVVCKFLSMFPKVFVGLGKLTDSYTIKMHDDVKPIALHVPYDVSQPRLPLVKRQLEDMEEKGVISKVSKATDWCSGMVQVPKADSSQIGICADLTNLNKAVKRDTHPSSSVDSSLAKVADAKFMTKLDANSGYY